MVFESAFRAIAGHTPLRWQARLFSEHFVKGTLPSAVSIPTGLGKTSVIPIWLIALATQGAQVRPTLPRRFVYIVNRRTVVDQATDLVVRMQARLSEPARANGQDRQVLEAMRNALIELSASKDLPLAVSTLRGGLADNEEWKTDPTRPAIVVGTIDMVGSKLLFSGYGDGRYKRAHHAGLIGQDTLIVHDEAHLTPAFSDLLHAIAHEQGQSNEKRPVQVMELSATTRSGNGAGRFVLAPEDEQDDIVPLRLDARKELRLHEVSDKKDVPEKVVEKAFAHEQGKHKVLVYVSSPEDAHKVVDGLLKRAGKKQEHRVAMLTGTLRGHERDKLVAENHVFRAMLGPDPVDATVYLVSTSAGEVGIDLDACNMVTDLTTLEGLVQRLGRVNRSGGEGRKAHVDVVAAEPKGKKSGKEDEGEKKPDDPYSVALTTTLQLLRHWAHEPLDASPRNMRRLVEELSEEERSKAFAPKGATRPLTDILLDSWSMTSIAGALPGRPAVAQYLHGVEASPPETHVVWRQEVQSLCDAGLSNDQLGTWFQLCPPLIRERLRDASDRVRKKLKELLQALRKEKPDHDVPVVLLDERGNAELFKLSEVVNDEGQLTLNYRTVVLPASAGGLNGFGALDAKHHEPVIDVADQIAGADDGARRERWFLTEGPDGAEWTRLTDGERTGTMPRGLREKVRIPIVQVDEGSEDDGSKYLVLLVGKGASATDNPETTSVQQTLQDHSQAVECHVVRMAEALGLDASLVRCLSAAARCHDLGKSRRVWQRYARNNDPSCPLAKAVRYGRPDELNGYRHEFGSLHDAVADPRFMELDKDEQELVLHLIAAHHGWGRPHFDRRAWDHEMHGAQANQALSTGVMQRFGRLQLEHGRWGLAWLESLLRCADISASKEAVINEVELQNAQA